MIQNQRVLLEQLRREANIKRINVSQAVDHLKVDYNLDNNKNQYLFNQIFILVTKKIESILHLLIYF